jgi:hypothetical protein
MKKGIVMVVLGLAVIAAGVVAVRAEEPAAGVASVELPAVGAVDLAGVVGAMRASVLVNSHGATFYGAHIPIVSLLGKTSRAEYINLNAGVVYSSDKKRADFMASLGFRLDSMVSKAGRKWPNIKTAQLPPVEVGPFLSYGFNKWMWGGMFSLRLGGK